MTRLIPAALAPALELLELERPVTITTREVTALVERAEVRTPAHVVIQRLAARGWLLKTGVRGVWEFAPAAHAGPYSHSARWLGLQAALHARPGLPVSIALGSALWLLDLTGRAPDTPEVALPAGSRVPAGLRGSYRIVRFDARLEPHRLRELPVQQPASVLVHLAQRPSHVRGWTPVLDVLADLAATVTMDDLLTELDERPHATWIRLAYLLSGVAPGLVEQLDVEPAGKVWFGPRGPLRHHDARWNVADTVLPTHPGTLGLGPDDR